MNNENTTLKPCPFCGGEAKHISAVRIECQGEFCNAQTIGVQGKEEMLRAWNTRPLEDALKAKADCFDELVEVTRAMEDTLGYLMGMTDPNQEHLISLEGVHEKAKYTLNKVNEFKIMSKKYTVTNEQAKELTGNDK